MGSRAFSYRQRTLWGYLMIVHIYYTCILIIILFEEYIYSTIIPTVETLATKSYFMHVDFGMYPRFLLNYIEQI
jgi:hypothetical protein